MTGGGASWATHCRWQSRLLDGDGEPLGGWRWADTLADCRQDFTESTAATAQVKRDGDSYGVLSRDGARAVLRRVTGFTTQEAK